MGIPLRKGRFLTLDAGVRQVHRQTNHVARKSGMFLKCPAHGLVDLWPLAMSQREKYFACQAHSEPFPNIV